jgi:hypothetical protein
MPKTYQTHLNRLFLDTFRTPALLENCDPGSTVEVPDHLIGVHALEFVYMVTNSVDAPYWVEHEDCVTLPKGSDGTRSLSVGDVVIDPLGAVWVVDMSGFRTQQEYNDAIPQKLARADCLQSAAMSTAARPLSRPARDGRWMETALVFREGVLKESIQDHPGGIRREGYVRISARREGHGLLYFPDTNKFWVFEYERTDPTNVTFGIGKIVFVGDDLRGAEAELDRRNASTAKIPAAV